MRRLAIFLVASFGVPHVQPAHGGLYNLAEPAPIPAMGGKIGKALPFREFRDRLTEFIQLGNDQLNSPLRQHYLARLGELEGKRRFGRLTVAEQVNLSGYLIRLKRYNAAIDLLTPLAAQERDNFLVLSNLITAHFQSGQFDQALRYFPQVERGRPSEGDKLTPEERDWFAHVEPYFQKLVKLRFRESRARQPGRMQDPTLDALFDTNLRFVGESGEYEAGQLAAAERSKLPADALAIVEQLLFWLPDDTRLYWLLGELLNAQGDSAGAAAVFAECRDSRRFDSPDLQKHRQILQETLARTASPSLDIAALPTTPATSPSWFAGKGRLLIVGGVVTLVVVGLIYLQLRELRRRGNP